jgi:hypothetical protein
VLNKPVRTLLQALSLYRFTSECWTVRHEYDGLNLSVRLSFLPFLCFNFLPSPFLLTYFTLFSLSSSFPACLLFFPLSPYFYIHASFSLFSLAILVSILYSHYSTSFISPFLTFSFFLNSFYLHFAPSAFLFTPLLSLSVYFLTPSPLHLGLFIY